MGPGGPGGLGPGPGWGPGGGGPGGPGWGPGGFGPGPGGPSFGAGGCFGGLANGLCSMVSSCFYVLCCCWLLQGCFGGGSGPGGGGPFGPPGGGQFGPPR